MKQLITSFAAYDQWANEKLLQTILALTEVQQQQEIISSFSSIHKTCLHVWDASSIWWQRMQGHTQLVVPSLSFHPSLKDISNGVLSQCEQWIDWINKQQPEVLSGNLAYKNLKGETFQQAKYEILLHLFNHGTYHRGQLVTMLRQIGIDDIPQTDYIVYARQK